MYEISTKERIEKMIPYENILLEIEKQLSKAKTTSDTAKMREAFAAIQSLSAVALTNEQPVKRHVQQLQSTVPSMTQTMQPQAQSVQSLDAAPIVEEDGANGASIFEF